MKKPLRIIYALSCLIIASCQSNPTDLVGNWQAAKLSENGDSVAIDPQHVRLRFSDEGQYHFRSTLNYEEAGTYRWDAPFLFTTDTTRTQQQEKAVRIDWIAQDTLLMQMQEAATKRELLLVRSPDLQ